MAHMGIYDPYSNKPFIPPSPPRANSLESILGGLGLLSAIPPRPLLSPATPNYANALAAFGFTSPGADRLELVLRPPALQSIS
jgi:hypothetical protein